MRLSRTITVANRAEIARVVELAPEGSQVEIMTDPRSLAQNKLMWRLLTQISEQVEHCGNKYDAESWKAAFMKEAGAKLRFMPSLDGKSVVAIGYQTRRLSKPEFSDFIERIYAFGVEHGVRFDDQPQESAA